MGRMGAMEGWVGGLARQTGWQKNPQCCNMSRSHPFMRDGWATSSGRAACSLTAGSVIIIITVTLTS